MPVEKLNFQNKQSRLFQDRLSNELNKRHKLYKLREAIDWDNLLQSVMDIIPVHELGRERKNLRVMLGLAMLQAMYNTSDCLTSETIDENAYWQYFCGYEHGQPQVGISETSIRRFRQTLGEVGYQIILKELAATGLRVGAYKKKDLASAIIDTTVQKRNVKYPHDAYLLGKAREEVVRPGAPSGDSAE